MQIQKSTVRGVAVVVLEGRFEFGTRNEYKRVIGQVVQEGFRQLVLDVQRVTFLDSSAIGLLLLTDQNFKLNKGIFHFFLSKSLKRLVVLKSCYNLGCLNSFLFSRRV
jgi:anti-anti-sigma factor